MTPKILTFDIETAPMEGYFWQLGEQYIGIDNVTQDWTILAYTAKWLDETRCIYNDTSGRGAKHVRNDKALVHELWKLLDEADIVVAQNGKRFDIRKVNARLLQLGCRPYSPIRVVDTYQVAKSVAGFSSNKLAWLSGVLSPDTPKLDHRKYPGIELWKACLQDSRLAWAEMKKYNIRDVVATEAVYLELRPWMKGHPNIGAYSDAGIPTCTNCGSTKLQARGTTVTQQGNYQRFQCQACGSWSRSKVNLLSSEWRKGMVHNA